MMQSCSHVHDWPMSSRRPPTLSMPVEVCESARGKAGTDAHRVTRRRPAMYDTFENTMRREKPVFPCF